jgi:hypothetical protein
MDMKVAKEEAGPEGKVCRLHDPRPGLGADLPARRTRVFPLGHVRRDQDSRLGQVGRPVPPDHGFLLEVPGREGAQAVRHPRRLRPEQRPPADYRCPLPEVPSSSSYRHRAGSNMAARGLRAAWAADSRRRSAGCLPDAGGRRDASRPDADSRALQLQQVLQRLP